MEFNRLIKDCRKKAQFTQKELAEKLNMSQNTISQYETGKRNIDSDTMTLFMDFFDMKITVETHSIKTKHTNILDEWKQKWKTMLNQENETLSYFSSKERDFIENIRFVEAHWFNSEDYEEGFHISVMYKEQECCIQKYEGYLTVSNYPSFSENFFRPTTLQYFETLLDNFEIEEKLDGLY